MNALKLVDQKGHIKMDCSKFGGNIDNRMLLRERYIFQRIQNAWDMERILIDIVSLKKGHLFVNVTARCGTLSAALLVHRETG